MKSSQPAYQSQLDEHLMDDVIEVESQKIEEEKEESSDDDDDVPANIDEDEEDESDIIESSKVPTT